MKSNPANPLIKKIKVQTNDNATSSNHRIKASGETVLGTLIIFLASGSWRHETTAVGDQKGGVIKKIEVQTNDNATSSSHIKKAPHYTMQGFFDIAKYLCYSLTICFLANLSFPVNLTL